MHKSTSTGLRHELERRSSTRINFYDWDPYILGATDQLTPEVLPAGELARREEARWSRGRFPSIPLCIADAVFSKQREYLSVVRSESVDPALKPSQNRIIAPDVQSKEPKGWMLTRAKPVESPRHRALFLHPRRDRRAAA